MTGRSLLRAQRERLGGALLHPDAFVFLDPRGAAVRANTLRSSHWKPLLRRAGLPETLRLHDLRHASASALANAGVPLNVLKERLGHASLRTTEVYLHSSEKAQREASDKLEQILGD